MIKRSKPDFHSIAIDNSGNVGLAFSGGPGAGIDAEARGGVMVHASNANTIEDLGGPFVNGNVSAGTGPDVSLDGFVGRNRDGSPIIGGGFTAGGGVGGGGAVTGTGSYVVPLFKLPDLFKLGGRGCQPPLPSPQPLPPGYPPTPTPRPAPSSYPSPVPQPAPTP